MSIKSKLVRNFGANAFGQIITVVIQLLSVPVFVSYWGVGLYGEWLILSAIPSYLSLTDMGFASVAANEMAIKIAKGSEKEALSVYQSVFFLIVSASILIGGGLVLAIFIFPVGDYLSLENIGEHNIKFVLVILIVYVLIGQQGNVFNSAFRSIGQYARGTMINNIARLVEWCGAMLLISLNFGVIEVASEMLALRFVTVFLLWWQLRMSAPWIELGLKNVSLSVLNYLWRPAIAFMVFPMGLAISLQGVILVVGATLGSIPVVIYSAYRTISRIVVQIVTLINQSVWPEISIAYGQNKIELIKTLHRTLSGVNLLIGGVVVIVLAIVGKWIIEIWLRGAVIHNDLLFGIMLITTFLNVTWQTSWVVLMATNNHQKLSVIFLMSTFSGLLLSYFVAPYYGIEGVGGVLFLCEFPVFYYAISRALSVLGDKWLGYTANLFRIDLKTFRGV